MQKTMWDRVCDLQEKHKWKLEVERTIGVQVEVTVIMWHVNGCGSTLEKACEEVIKLYNHHWHKFNKAVKLDA